jgi:hypothetical protein
VSPPPAAAGPATAVSAALTERQRTVIALGTPRLYRYMAGWPVASMLTELSRMGVYDDEIAEFLAVNPVLALDPGARFAAIAARRIGPMIFRSAVTNILARRPHPPWKPPAADNRPKRGTPRWDDKRTPNPRCG